MTVKPSEIAALHKRIGDLERIVSNQTKSLTRYGPQEPNVVSGDVIECEAAEEVDIYEIGYVHENTGGANRLPSVSKYDSTVVAAHDVGEIGIIMSYGEIGDKIYVQIDGIQFARIDKTAVDLCAGRGLKPNDSAHLEYTEDEGGIHFYSMDDYNDGDDILLVKFSKGDVAGQEYVTVVYDSATEQFTATVREVKVLLAGTTSGLGGQWFRATVASASFIFDKKSVGYSIYFGVWASGQETVAQIFWYSAAADVTTDATTLAAEAEHITGHGGPLTIITFQSNGTYTVDSNEDYANKPSDVVVIANNPGFNQVRYWEANKRIVVGGFRSVIKDIADNEIAISVFLTIPVSTDSDIYIYQVGNDVEYNLTLSRAVAIGERSPYRIGYIKTDAAGKLLLLYDYSRFANFPPHHYEHITNPSGGATVDAEARSKIVSVLDLLEELQLMKTVGE